MTYDLTLEDVARIREALQDHLAYMKTTNRDERQHPEIVEQLAPRKTVANETRPAATKKQAS